MLVLLIILTLVFVVILLAINIYLLALYCHPDDKGWGNVVYCKILVVLGLTLCQAQALMVPLDVANQSALIQSDGINMTAFWTFLYIIILIMISVLIPYALFFYETDQDDPMRKRLLRALCYTFGALVITIMILFITWAVFKNVNLPYTQVALKQAQTVDISGNIAVPQPVRSTKQINLQASLAVYIIALLSFFGWILLVIFGGVGLFALPIDMINAFRHRPKARKSSQMRKAKDAIVHAITSLVDQGQKLKTLDDQNAKNTQAGFFTKWKQGRQINKQLTQFKAKYYSLEQQYTIFNLQLKFADTNPIIPILKLILGIVFLITSILWLIQIIFGNIAKAYNNVPLIKFFNELLIGLQNGNAGFIATFIFAYLCLYMLWCVQKGNVKFGIRIPFCCRFHPMKQNQTWMNTFLFNVILLLIASVGVIQLCISSFPSYTRNTDIYMIFGNTVNYMNFYKFFYDKNVFTIAFVIWTFISLIYLIVTINKKPGYMKQIQRIAQQKNGQRQKIKE